MSDALARVKAWPETCPDIEALVREVEAGRRAEEFLQELGGYWAEHTETESERKSILDAYDAARKEQK